MESRQMVDGRESPRLGRSIGFSYPNSRRRLHRTLTGSLTIGRSVGFLYPFSSLRTFLPSDARISIGRSIGFLWSIVIRGQQRGRVFGPALAPRVEPQWRLDRAPATTNDPSHTLPSATARCARRPSAGQCRCAAEGARRAASASGNCSLRPSPSISRLRYSFVSVTGAARVARSMAARKGPLRSRPRPFALAALACACGLRAGPCGQPSRRSHGLRAKVRGRR